MKKWINTIIDYIVVITQISFGISIIPYIIYDNINPFPLAIFLNALLVFFALFLRFGNEIYFKKSILFFPPIFALFTLMVIQIISGVINQNTSSFFSSIILIFNFLVFIIYIVSLFEYNYKKVNYNFDKAFYNTAKPYVHFALLNLVLVLLASLLIVTGYTVPFTNNISDLYINLLGNNVSTGTVYFMPGWISIQTMNERLIGGIGTLSGLTHEPHVFGYLVIPSLFIILSQVKKKSTALIISLIYLLAGIISFSTTTLLVLAILIFIWFFLRRNYLIIPFVFIFYFLVKIFAIDIPIFITIKEYTFNKLFDDTSSMDYSTNKITNIILPKTFFGDGVLLIGNPKEGNAGFFSAIFYIYFYVTIMIEIAKNFFFKTSNKKIFIGFALLYFFLHGFKLSSSVFAMPYTIFFLVLLWLYKAYSKDRILLIDP